jgi:hypothetical protein
MLTERQFKVLMILFDNEGHAGWQLAADLHMTESNLNPYLKDLMKKEFIIQGTPRKSMKPKKREGDYKEFPYYLTKDLEILGTIIKEMVIADRLYDRGFPFRIIETSKYIRLMKSIFKEDLNRCLAGFKRREFYSREFYERCLPSELEPELEENSARCCMLRSEDLLRELHSLSDEGELPQYKDKFVTEKSLKRLEHWYQSYSNKHYDQESSSSDNGLIQTPEDN